ncbi:MAG: polyisoprenyl-teichoic acid--peptidoglycan teichoic acid transferase [Geotoga sp.]|nr:polyisoprenyl-teichoic acid--peptidoglycan teichoic acid transferase [Geotoga sp.]
MRNIIIKSLGVLLSFLILFSIFFSLLKNINISNNIKTPYYFLVIGVDSVDNYESRTDTILLGAIENNQINFYHFPRDLLLNIEGKERRINSIYSIYGIDELLTQVEKIAEINIDDYIFFNYEIFKEIGNMISPVKIIIEEDMNYIDYHQDLKIDFQKGINNLNGEELLSYMRFRNDALGDIGRIERQKKALYAMLDSAQKKGFRTLFDIFEYVQENTKNTFDLQKMMSLYSYVRDANIFFGSLPTIIEGNYLLIDNSEIDDFKDKVKFIKKEESKQEVLSVLFTKNYINYNYSFYTYVFEHWQKKGYRIKVLDKKIDNFESKNSVVFIKNNNYKNKILNDLKESFPDKKFITIQDTKLYFKLIEFLTDNFIDTTKYEALVIINE